MSEEREDHTLIDTLRASLGCRGRATDRAPRDAADQPVDLIPRAALVAWLRERAQMRGRIGRTWESVGISSVADAIERGDAP